MKWILVLSLLGPLSSLAAVAPRQAPDTVERPLHSEKEFMQRYGTDDSSRALIRFYFLRGKGYRALIWLPFVFAVPLLAVDLALWSDPPYLEDPNHDLKILGMILLFVATISLAIMWSVINAFRFHHFRARLRASLRQYRETGKIPKRIAESKRFRACLRGEPGVHLSGKPKAPPMAAFR